MNTQFFNRAAFAIPALGEYGDTDFNEFNGPAYWTLDAALSRAFNVGGNNRVELRVEAFNLLNAVRAEENPAAAFYTLSSPNFGRVVEVEDPRIFQFAVKYVF
jgi:hypothetical protein